MKLVLIVFWELSAVTATAIGVKVTIVTLRTS